MKPADTLRTILAVKAAIALRYSIPSRMIGDGGANYSSAKLDADRWRTTAGTPESKPTGTAIIRHPLRYVPNAGD